MNGDQKLKGADTAVYVIDKNGAILFIKTFYAENNEAERLAAIDCYAQVRKSYGYATLSSIEYFKINEIG